jgi:hypothetical protein
MERQGQGEVGRRRLWLGWPAVLLAGWLLYELTASPGLAAAVACAKFGWADWQAARWLRRVDPDRRRGATCFWCYLTFGLWKVALSATVTMILLGFVGSLLDAGARPAAGNNNGPSPVLGGALAAASAGFGLSFVTTYVALWSALRNGVRVWLGVAPHRARAERVWPPFRGQTNFAPYVAFTTLVLTVWVVVLAVVGILLAWRPAGPVGAGLLLVLMVGLISSLLMTFPVLGQRLFARTPRECWPVVPGEAAYQQEVEPDALGRSG